MKKVGQGSKNDLQCAKKKYKTPYIFIAPFFIMFIIFQLIPVIWTFVISFFQWRGYGSMRWVGLRNYTVMLQTTAVTESFINTVWYWIVCVIGVITCALFIAMSLNSRFLIGRKAFQTISFLPYVCASVAIGLIFMMLFDENAGLINDIIGVLGGQNIPWLTSSRYAKIPVATLFIWRITPWYTIIIFSGLLNISPEYYEVATVDGASIIQQFRHITLPLLKNILYFCALTVTIDIWKMFNESYTLSGPGSSNSTLFQQMYQYGFRVMELGYASAISVVLILVLLVISVIQYQLRKKEGEV